MNTQTATSSSDTRSPFLRQYEQLKEKYPETVLLFRSGDFYKAYREDAKTAERVLGITRYVENDTQAGIYYYAFFPFHALDTYLPRLIRAGCRVAICDQLEPPRPRPTEVVTPSR